MTKLLKTLIAKVMLVVFYCQTTLAGAVQVSPYLDIPTAPFYVGQSVPPNLMLTLDDSGSMMWAYVPDTFGGIDTQWTTGNAATGARALSFKSSLNGLYYNPSAIYTAPVDAGGTPYPTSFTNAWLNGYATGQGSMNLATAYKATQYYDAARQNAYGFGDYLAVPHCSTAETNSTTGFCPGVGVAPNTGTRAYYWTYNIGTGCPDQLPTLTWQPPVSCFTFNSVSVDQEQNFANWFSFYRTRNLATVSAAISAFSGLPSDYRVAWQALNSCAGGSNSFSSSCRGWDSSRANVDARIGSFTASKKADMWTWMTRLPSYNGTPLRQALDRTGKYLQTTGSSSPYADLPGNSSTTYASCRQSYSVMMTDGKWNSSGPYSTGIGNVDNSSATMPDGTAYSPQAPFRDTNSASLADIAAYYWRTDLQPTLTDNIRPYMPNAAIAAAPTAAEYWDPRNDPAKWQHMTSFFVGLGLSRSLDNPDWVDSTFGGSATAPYTGYYSLLNGGVPWPATGDDAVGNVADMWHAAINSRGAFFSVETPQALVEAFKQIRNRISDQTGASTAVAQSSFQVQTESMAFAASYSTTKWDGTMRGYKVNSDGSTAGTATWSSDTTIDYLGVSKFANNTRILARGSTGSLVPFNASNVVNLPSASKTALDNTAVTLGVSTTAMVNWILGDDSNTLLRSRERLLGDVLGSQPVFEGGRDYGYVETLWPNNSDGTRIDGVVYANYVKSKSPGGSKYKPTVYFGANDGMLHALNGDTGARRFAFIPTALMSKLGKRADRGYVHDYYVDGPIALHDVYNGSEWRTILVATFGAGGKGAFSLDVTDPDSPQLLWEFTPSDTDLGYILGEPVVARATDGTWVTVFGNGYGSASNKAVLYVVNALNGGQLRKIEAVESGTSAPTSAQGLSAPALLYLAGRQLGFAYAGDWQGNLWRFDIGASTVGTWSLGFAAKPLFKARTAGGAVQRITAKPRLVSDRTLGRVIVFGTGKLLELTDKDDLSIQTFYGIYDKASGATSLRGDLTQQTILTENSTTRTTSKNTLTKPAGWYLDLTSINGANGGERVLSSVTFVPELSVVLATTVEPAGGACDASMSSALMAFSPWSGAANSLFTVGGTATNGVMMQGVVATPSVLRKGGTMTVMVNRGIAGIEKVSVTKGWNPRAAWRQLR